MNIPLSKLVADRRNPRRVRPEREAHRRLVASIRAHGLLEPLIVRPEDDHFRVIAGKRRLAALRDIHRGEDAKVLCVVRAVDPDTAEGLSLAENFVREPMHPLDEAETFARLASVDRGGVHSVAAEFGVTERYVRQRIKLDGLCDTVKAAYRQGRIDTATAEAFATVPPTRQEELWHEVGGHPRHAQQVRSLIEDRWIDAGLALFDVSTLAESAISADLFRERVLVEREAFMEAQLRALEAERERLTEEGWSEVVIGERGELYGRVHAMAEVPPDLTEAEQDRLGALEAEARALEGDETNTAELDRVEAEIEAILQGAEGRHSDEAKARGTVFLMLTPEGEVARCYRVPRSQRDPQNTGLGGVPPEQAEPLTASDLTDRQRAALHMHEAVSVRQAVLASPVVQKRLLVLVLHEKVVPDALSLRRQVNATTLYAQQCETFRSDAYAVLFSVREAIDPFRDEAVIEEAEAYERLCGLPEETLDRLIAMLVADCLTGHAQRHAALIGRLRAELGVAVRDDWTPDADWLSGYRKIQLADLLGTLRGNAHRTAALRRKKPELVDELAALFAGEGDASEDRELAVKARAWTPTREE